MSKRVRVVFDTARGARECELELAADATIAAAIDAAMATLGEIVGDWDHAAAGIFGKVLPRTHIPEDGDRIELYRALQIDPRSARRHRAAKARASRAASGGRRR